MSDERIPMATAVDLARAQIAREEATARVLNAALALIKDLHKQMLKERKR